MIFIPFPIFLYNELRKDFFIRRILEGIIAINSTLKQDQDKPRDIPTILNSIQQTYKATNWILHFQKFSKGSSLYGLYISECEYILNILSVLRSDLATRLTEQQQILKSAKTEVEENITGTPELIAVSEAQQVRLDRQIEQFEELQQVLVRV